MLAWWWGVDLGSDCRFYGVPRFRREPGSIIRISENCEFRSAVWSNLIGLNRPCIISTLHPNAVLQIGKSSGFSGTTVGCSLSISIGDRVMCGANVTITDTDWHAIRFEDRSCGHAAETAPVVVEDDVWLGLNVVVLKGVRIGRGTVIGAGSIVTRSIPSNVLAVGQPAQTIRVLQPHASRNMNDHLARDKE